MSRSLPLFLNNGQVQIYQTGAQTIVSVDFGLTVSYDGWSFVVITLPYSYRGKTGGLYGNFNGNPYDDFISRSENCWHLSTNLVITGESLTMIPVEAMKTIPVVMTRPQWSLCAKFCVQLKDPLPSVMNM